MLPTSLTAAHHTTTSHASFKEPHRSAAIQLANRTGRTAHEKQQRDGNPSIERPPMQAGKVLITLQRYSLLTRDLRPTSALVGHYLCLRLLLLASFWAEHWLGFPNQGLASFSGRSQDAVCEMSPGYSQHSFLPTKPLTQQPHMRAPKILITLQLYDLLTILVLLHSPRQTAEGRTT